MKNGPGSRENFVLRALGAHSDSWQPWHREVFGTIRKADVVTPQTQRPAFDEAGSEPC